MSSQSARGGLVALLQYLNFAIGTSVPTGKRAGGLTRPLV